MALTPEGTPLGLMDVQCWARDSRSFGKHHQRKEKSIEQKESYKWLKSYQAAAEAQRQCPDTMIVSVGDREADIYELFELALEDPHGPKLLVRGEQDRLLADGQGHLWPFIEKQPLAGAYDLQVARRLVHVDVPWNPMELEQRVGRVHRFGSRRKIIVDTVVALDSREVDMYRVAREKLYEIVSTLVPEDRFEGLFTRVMSLVPPEDLQAVLGERPLSPLTGEEKGRIAS